MSRSDFSEIAERVGFKLSIPGFCEPSVVCQPKIDTKMPVKTPLDTTEKRSRFS